MVNRGNRFSGFENIVSSVDEIRVAIGEPLPPAIEKVIHRLDNVCRAFIEKSPFVVIASANSDGEPDISPKGDPEGFVRVLDDKHLAIPDRPGNRRIDTYQNILENPQVAVIFIIPGKGETLRVRGEARIIRDEALRKSMEVNGRVPEFAMVVHVDEAFIHCSKCMVRSKLWQPDVWPDHSRIPNITEAVITHANLDITPEEYRAQLEAAGRAKLY